MSQLPIPLHLGQGIILTLLNQCLGQFHKFHPGCLYCLFIFLDILSSFLNARIIISCMQIVFP